MRTNSRTLQRHFQSGEELMKYHKGEVQGGNEYFLHKNEISKYNPPETQDELKEFQKYGCDVRINRIKGDTAYCNALLFRRKYPIQLNAGSLRECDLYGGDLFKWIPREDGVVRLEDITSHPRRLSEEKIREAIEVFERLRREFPKGLPMRGEVK